MILHQPNRQSGGLDHIMTALFIFSFGQQVHFGQQFAHLGLQHISISFFAGGTRQIADVLEKYQAVKVYISHFAEIDHDFIAVTLQGLENERWDRSSTAGP